MFKFSPSALSEQQPTLIQNEYGGVTLIPPSRPEPPRPVRVEMTYDEVVKTFFGNDAQLFETVVNDSSFQFPQRMGRRSDTKQSVWWRDNVEKWLQNDRVALIKRLAHTLR